MRSEILVWHAHDTPHSLPFDLGLLDLNLNLNFIQGASPSCRRPPSPARMLPGIQFSRPGRLAYSEGFESSIIRILLGSDALGSLILCILRGSEVLRRSIICIWCFPELPGAPNWNSGGLEAAILNTFITSGGLDSPPTRDILILNIVNVLKTMSF